MRGNQEDIDMNNQLGAVLIGGAAVLLIGGVVVLGCAAGGVPLFAAATISGVGATFVGYFSKK